MKMKLKFDLLTQFSQFYSVFPLPETDSYAKTETDVNGFNSNMQNYFH